MTVACRLIRKLRGRFAGSAPNPPFPMPPVVLSPPGPGGVRITEDGLIGNWYSGEGQERRAAVLLLGGSEGGLGSAAGTQAMDLNERGFAVLQLAYFGVSGLPPALVMVPLEYFDIALKWMSQQQTVDMARIGMIGGSRGAEAALLIAARNPNIRAAVVGCPSAVAWPGIDFAAHGTVQSSWSAEGIALPFLPYGGPATTMLDAYEKALQHLPDYPDAAIPVNRIGCRVLLVCGRDDTLWPSCTMAGIVARTMGKRASILAYDDAGHGVFGPPVSPASPEFPGLATFGGSAAGNNAARQDSWPKVRQFLSMELSST